MSDVITTCVECITDVTELKLDYGQDQSGLGEGKQCIKDQYNVSTRIGRTSLTFQENRKARCIYDRVHRARLIFFRRRWGAISLR